MRTVPIYEILIYRNKDCLEHRFFNGTFDDAKKLAILLTRTYYRAKFGSWKFEEEDKFFCATTTDQDNNKWTVEVSLYARG